MRPIVSANVFPLVRPLVRARVRPMLPGDVAQVAVLAGQLGYPSTAEGVAARLRAIGGADTTEHGLFVAEDSGTSVGWAHVLGVRRLDSDGYAELLSLVVDAACRRRGIGRMLVQRACEWTRSAGFARLRLRSGLHRADAHAFYAALGFDIARPGHTFQVRV